MDGTGKPTVRNRQFIFPVVSPWKNSKEWDIMYQENKKVSEALRNGRMTHEPGTEPEHTPRGNQHKCSNSGKKHAIPTPAPSRAGEQDKSQPQARQTTTMHQQGQRDDHGPPAAPPPSPEYDAMPPERQGLRVLNREQSPQEKQNWQVVQPSKHQLKRKSLKEGTPAGPRRSDRNKTPISYKGM